MQFSLNKKDIIAMHLVHYFITEENYQPIIVNGVQNEIWLENINSFYKVIRINTNYIHNIEQLKLDNYKIKSVTKQIKKKTFSFNIKTLNILLELNDNVEIDNINKNIDNYKISGIKDIRKNDGLAGLFPKLKTLSLYKGDNIETLLHFGNDISVKNEKENAEYEKIFKPKKIIINNIIIILNLIIYILNITYPEINNYFILNPVLVKSGKIYLLLTSLFCHGNIIHFISNMYALYIVGNQIENTFGKRKYLIIYLFSGLTSSLLSCLTNYSSLGASGAIFGLFGALLYFGYYYRLYFGSVILKQIVPVILANLLIGFAFSNINNVAHIGGLIGGIFITMALKVSKNKEKQNNFNGYIISLIYLLLLIYLVFIAK